jgi:(S)-sulfolactate dehydrogenase
VRNRTQVDATLLDAAPKLKVVGRLGVGLDNIDLVLCERRGVAVCPAMGAGTVSVAEYVIAALLVLLRRSTYRCTESVIAGEWPRTIVVGRDVAGKCLGLVGFGAIARAVAKRALALDMTVVAYDPFVPKDDVAWQLAESRALPDLLAMADVVSLHVPLTDETRHLIDEASIATMKPGAIVINAARGGIIDEQAIVDALRDGHLGGAALDVFESEPLSAASAAPFADVPNLIVTPHVAGITDEANQRTGEITVANVRSVLEAQA